jgi:single-stranded DNA-specific DHH superfamily exonuclease
MRLTAADFIPTLLVDAAVTLDEITEKAATEAISLQPFGAGNPRPLLIARGVEICGQPVWMKENTCAFPVPPGWTDNPAQSLEFCRPRR